MNIYILNNGCQEAQIASNQLERFFSSNETPVTNIPERADVIIFLACGLTKDKEIESLEIVQDLQEKYGNAKLIVWGCLPNINPKALEDRNIDSSIGFLDLRYFEGIPEKIMVPIDSIHPCSPSSCLQTKTPGHDFEKNLDLLTMFMVLGRAAFNKIKNFNGRKGEIFWVIVSTGCSGNCTYCSEKLVFHGVHSRSIEDICADINHALDQGYRRFSIHSTDFGSYGMDIKSTPSALLSEIVQLNDSQDFSIIINQFEPHFLVKYFSDLEKIFATDKIEAIGIPVQSGSNRILTMMGRRYTAEDWRNHVIQINKKFPKIQVDTHFMVGFPSETEEDFAATLRLLRKPLHLHNATVFKFSNRPSIRISNHPEQISEYEKELRYRRLLREFVWHQFSD
jgi:tRNA A37 methylthiotransferase MiaB